MFRQVSGECGRRLQGSCQSGPQCPEESPEAEKTQDLPAAVTLGLTAPSGTVVELLWPGTRLGAFAPSEARSAWPSGAGLLERSGPVPLGFTL